MPRLPVSGVWRRGLDRPDIRTTRDRRSPVLEIHIDQRPYGTIQWLFAFREISKARFRRSSVHSTAVKEEDVGVVTREHDLASRNQPHKHVLQEGSFSWGEDSLVSCCTG